MKLRESAIKGKMFQSDLRLLDVLRLANTVYMQDIIWMKPKLTSVSWTWDIPKTAEENNVSSHSSSATVFFPLTVMVAIYNVSMVHVTHARNSLWVFASGARFVYILAGFVYILNTESDIYPDGGYKSTGSN